MHGLLNLFAVEGLFRVLIRSAVRQRCGYQGVAPGGAPTY
jgi:hypothetical protein